MYQSVGYSESPLYYYVSMCVCAYVYTIHVCACMHVRKCAYVKDARVQCRFFIGPMVVGGGGWAPSCMKHNKLNHDIVLMNG